MLGVSEGMNLFLFQTGKGKRTLLKDEYIEKVTIKKTLPNTVSISIIERTVCGYVPYRGAYLYIDEYGRVLDVATSYTEPLPIVKGLEFTSFQKGELLSVKNPESFDVIVQIAQLIKKYKILDMILEIDVSDPKDIKAYINKVEIFLGSIEDCDEKIRNLIEIMKEIPEKDRGSIDLRDMSKMPVFKYLT